MELVVCSYIRIASLHTVWKVAFNYYFRVITWCWCSVLEITVTRAPYPPIFWVSFRFQLSVTVEVVVVDQRHVVCHQEMFTEVGVSVVSGTCNFGYRVHPGIVIVAGVAIIIFVIYKGSNP